MAPGSIGAKAKAKEIGRTTLIYTVVTQSESDVAFAFAWSALALRQEKIGDFYSFTSKSRSEKLSPKII